MMKKFTALLLVLSMALGLASCSSGGPSASDGGQGSGTSQPSGGEAGLPSGEITFMVIDSFKTDDNPLEASTAAFMEAYPDVKVTIEYVSANDIKDKFTTSALSGAGPDVVALDSAGYAIDAAASNLLQPLDEDLTPIADQFYEAQINSGMYNGSYYAVPWYMNNMAMYYNQDILDAAGVTAVPTTWDEFVQAIEKITAAGYDGITMPYYFCSYWMYAYFFQNGNPVIDTSSDVPVSTLTDESGQETWTYLCDLVTKYHAYPESIKDALSWDQTYAPFLQGNCAFLFSGDWANWSLSGSDINYGIAKLPAGKEAATVMGGYTLSINRNTKNYDAAWAYISWLTSAEHSQEILSGYGRVSARKDADTTQVVAENPHLEVFVEQNGDSMARPSVINISEFDTMFSDAYKEVILGTKSPEDALNALHQEATNWLTQQYG